MQSETLAARCRGRWPEFIAALAPNEHLLRAIELWRRNPSAARHGPCPVHGGDHGDAFRVFKDFGESGGAVCNTCGKFGNGFRVLMWINAWDEVRTGRELRDLLDRNRPVTCAPVQAFAQTAQSHKEPIESDDKNDRYVYQPPSVERLLGVWNEAYALTHVAARPVRLYFKSRGLADLDLVPLTALRFHPRLFYYDRERGVPVGYFGVLLAYVTGTDGRLVALHRTFLTQDGYKAPVSKAKKLWTAHDTTASGGAVRLHPAGSILSTCEGLENGLTGLLRNPEIPLWPTTSAPLLGSLVLPAQVRHVVIWADLEPPKVQPNGSVRQPGRDAANKLTSRLNAESRTSEQLIPRVEGEAKLDWNKVLIKYGLDAIPRLSTKVRMLPTAYRLARLPYGTVSRR